MSFKKIVLSVAVCTLLVSAYIVQRGDTLWDLSAEYLKDPFAWQDLWQANQHIENPHLIFPGDSLCIPGQAPCPQPGGAAASGAAATAVGEDGQVVASGSVAGGEGAASGPGFRRHEPPKMFNAYYQRLMPIVEPASSKGSTRGWYHVFSEEPSRPVNHFLEHEVLLGFGRRAFPNLKAGDLADIWSNDKIRVPNSAGSFDEYYMRRLAAVAKITAVGDSLSRATIVQSLNLLPIETARARPQVPVETIDLKSFTPVNRVRVEDMSRVLVVLDKSLVASLYSYVLIDKGKGQNYEPGAAVAFWDLDKRDVTLPPRLLGRGIVVYADNGRSTVLIRDIYNASRRIDAGTPVSLTHLPVK
ncbi:MAG: LysM peptidoglycan-binding domain-containing protein [Fibromonadaceae bacterium]|jgi:hypothetical protein|nr:LysM peptidoglycan-binding domain-containing protein [Fibromonadaceae bacterium]